MLLFRVLKLVREDTRDRSEPLLSWSGSRIGTGTAIHLDNRVGEGEGEGGVRVGVRVEVRVR